MFDVLIQMPTGVFTILLTLVLVYWLFVIVGAIDLDMFDGAGDAAGEALDGMESASGLVNALKLKSAPVTIVFSFIIFYSWLFTALLANTVMGLGGPGWLMGALVAVVGLCVSLPLTSVSIQPLAPVFESDHAESRADQVGKVCVISTGKVTKTFGQATVAEGDLLIQVRCERPEGIFSRGERALIIDYDEDMEAYLIEPLDPMMYG